jgi:hypothetical protein
MEAWWRVAVVNVGECVYVPGSGRGEGLVEWSDQLRAVL